VHERLLVIACGALGREISALKRIYGWDHLQLRCLDPLLHNRPGEIPGVLERELNEHRGRFDRVFVAYADCGTGGEIDRVLTAEGIEGERLPGAHCYEFFAGGARFAALSTAEPGTFYLTDFLARNFDRLVLRPLGLVEHPELRDVYFGHYRRLVLLSQTQDESVQKAAERAAAVLELQFEHVHCGYGDLEAELVALNTADNDAEEDHYLLA
jgi:hypothetical protein